MSASNTFSRLLIVNGQPILIKEDISLNPTQNLTPDILQQAIDDVTDADPISPISCGRSDDEGGIKNSHINTHESNGESEYVAVISSDQSNEDVSASTIQLTLEQAAELGIHFTVDTVEDTLQAGTNVNKAEEVKAFSHASQFLSSSSSSDILKSNADCVQIEADMTCGLENDIDKGNASSSFIDSFGPVNTSENHPLAIVPQIVNGTVTYTLQLCNQSQSHTSTNDFFTIDDSSIITQIPQPQKGLKLDVNNLSTLSSLSYINPNLDVRGKKLLDTNNVTLTTQDSTPSQSFGLVNSDDLTFVSLTDAIPGVRNISNMVTNINVTKQPNNVKPIQNLTKDKVTAGESLLTKQRMSLTKNVISSNNVNISKQKISGKFNISKQMLSNTASKLGSECSHQLLKSSAGEAVTKIEKVTSMGNNDERSALNLLAENNISVTSLNSITKDGNKKANEDLSISRPRSTPTIITPHVGNFPEEISTAMNRFPIKTDSNKPLGSNENPIKLVQQGTTFHSMQELTEDHISKIKPILQENFETKTSSKNVVYDPSSNTRIIYRIISPEEVSLRKQDEFPRRRGRPKKVRFPNSSVDYVEDGAPVPKKFYPRTRSGRLSRPPKHMVRDYKHIRRVELDDSDGAYSDYQSDHEVEISPSLTTEPVELLPGLVANRKCNKRNISAGNFCPTCGKVYLGYVRMKRHFDKYPEHGSIEYLDTIRNSNLESEVENLRINAGNGLWKKGKRKGKGRGLLFTGDKRTRLKEVLDMCSEADVADVAGPAVAGVLSLWELLLLRVDAVKEDNHSRIRALYDEVRQLLHRLRQMATQLFHPLDHTPPPGSKDVTIQIDDELMTSVLDIPSGMYLACEDDLNLDEVRSPPEHIYSQASQVTSKNPTAESKGPEKNMQAIKSKMDLDEVSEPFLLTSEEMICDSDDRGLVNVDEIVSERLQNFTGRLQPSAVDELMKGLNELDHRDNKIEADDLMEGFSIASRRAHVSASTEDLMKSLEHFESDLNHSDAPVSLDRDTFDRVASVDTIDFEVLSREFHSNNR